MDVKLRKDGSSDVTLVYKIQNEFGNMGAFGEESDLPPIPLTKDDFLNIEKAAQGAVKLESWNLKNDKKDLIYTIKLKFASPAALEAFLNQASAPSTRLLADKNGGSLTFQYWHNTADAASKDLLISAFEGYTMDVSVTLPSDYTVSYTDTNGNALTAPPSGSVQRQGKKFTISTPMSAVFTTGKDASFVLKW